MINKNLKSIVQYIILLSIGGLLVFLSIKRTNVSKKELFYAFSQANWFWIIISLIISFFSHFARAYRWNYLLENYHYRIKLSTAVSSVLIGYLANYGLPRMGEISRCAIVNKYNKIPIDIALGTVIAERIIDLILMFMIFIAVIIFQFNDIHTLFNQYFLIPVQQKINNIHSLYTLIIIITTVLILYFTLKKKKNSNQTSLFNKIVIFLQNIIQPIFNIHKIKKPISFTMWSILIWLSYFFSMYTCSLSLPATEKLGLLNVLVLFLFGTIGVIVTPGGIGAYHFLITEILLYYNIDKASAVAFPWIIWGTQFLLILIAGSLSFILLPLLQNKRKNYD